MWDNKPALFGRDPISREIVDSLFLHNFWSPKCVFIFHDFYSETNEWIAAEAPLQKKILSLLSDSLKASAY